MPSDLPTLRRRIEEVDAAIVRLIAERTQLAREAAVRKRADGQPVRDPAQEAVVLDRAAAAARDLGLDRNAVRRVFEELLRIARAVQQRDE